MQCFSTQWFTQYLDIDLSSENAYFEETFAKEKLTENKNKKKPISLRNKGRKGTVCSIDGNTICQWCKVCYKDIKNNGDFLVITSILHISSMQKKEGDQIWLPVITEPLSPLGMSWFTPAVLPLNQDTFILNVRLSFNKNIHKTWWTNCGKGRSQKCM